MLIKFCCLVCFVCLTSVCLCQTNDASYGVVITKVQKETSGRDTTRHLYVRNNVGDRLAVYKVTDGTVFEAAAYRLGRAGGSLWLYSHPLLTNELTKDSTRIDLKDETNTVIINGRDRYQLFPGAYAIFKEQVVGKHSLMALLTLLADGLGDYPISSALTLVNYRPVLAKQIKQAIIKTQRSQADMIDTWMCNYLYNKSQKLGSVVARSGEEIRFTKKVLYQKGGSVRIDTYLDIESRQTTNRSTYYGRNERAPIKWTELYLETGKNRETKSSATLTWHDLGMLQNQEPSNAEILEILKPPTLHKYEKKHMD